MADSIPYMAIINRVKEDRMSKCKSCGAEIIWIKTKNGKNMPCDAKPISYRNTFPQGSLVLMIEEEE